MKFFLLLFTGFTLYGVWTLAGPDGRAFLWSRCKAHVMPILVIALLAIACFSYILSGGSFRLF